MADDIDALFGQLGRRQAPDLIDPQPVGWTVEGGMAYAYLSSAQHALPSTEMQLDSGHGVLVPVVLPPLVDFAQLIWGFRIAGTLTVGYEWVFARDIGAGNSPIVVARYAGNLGSKAAGQYWNYDNITPVTFPGGVYWWVLRNTTSGTIYVECTRATNAITTRRRVTDIGTLPAVGSPIVLAAGDWPWQEGPSPAGILVAQPLGWGVTF